MKYYVFKGSTPYCGTDFEEYVAFGDEVTEKRISRLCRRTYYEPGG